MSFLSQITLDLYFSREYLKAAVLVCLLSVWVLVGLFYYLNHYTRRRYFTIWTAAWLFYALWITLTFGMRGEQSPPWLLMLQQWCVGVSAVFLFWGSQRFLGQRLRQRLMGSFMVFLLVWSYIAAYHLDNQLQMQVPLFALLAGAGLMTAHSFFKYRRQHPFIGATLLAVGFSLWAVYMAGYPFLENSEDLVSVALFVSAVIQLLVAVSMIVLVLEESRSSHQVALEQAHLRKRERDVLQTRVAASEERYRTLFEQAGEAIIVTSRDDLRILELNSAAKRLVRLTSDEALRHRLNTFFPEKNSGSKPASAEEWFESVIKRPSIHLIRKDGGTVPVEIAAAKADFDGQPCFQFFIREMTERARLEQQLRQAEKLSALGQMISGIAHELNNPLAAIKGYIELILAHHKVPEQTRSDLEKVAQESERATKLVRNFLSFAREQPSRREMVDVNEVVQKVAEMRQLDFKVAATELVLDLEPNLPRTAAGRDQIHQVLIILVNNALQAMAEMPATGRVRVQTRTKGGWIQILVEDNGPGVPPDLVARIFEPFFTTKEVGTGTGLGLSIAHSIMTEHKGRILYQPSSIGGAGFLLELPVTDAAGAAVNEPEEEVNIPNQPAIAASRGRNILVVDDEASLAQLLSEMLKIIGHTPTACNSAMHALEIMAGKSFDLVISDFRMPGMNGQQFYETAVSRHPGLAKRFVFLTGDVVNEETQAFLRSTGNPHLGKPFNLSKVKGIVADVLSGRELALAR